MNILHRYLLRRRLKRAILSLDEVLWAMDSSFPVTSYLITQHDFYCELIADLREALAEPTKPLDADQFEKLRQAKAHTASAMAARGCK